jgi:nitric oxide reductase NorD protein
MSGHLRLVGRDPVPPPDPRVRAAFPGDWLAPWLRGCRRLEDAGYGAGVCDAYREASIGCATVLGPEPAIELADLISSATIKGGRVAARQVAAAALRAAQRLEAPRRFRDWCSLMQRLTALAPESLGEIAERTDELLGRLTVAGLEAWCLAGVRSGVGDAARRLAFFRFETAEAERVLALEAGEASFLDRERRLRAFQRSLFGQAPVVREAPPGRHDGAGRRASFAGGVISMPGRFAGFSGARGELLFRAAMAHIAAHLRHSGPLFPVGQLKPLQIAVVSLIEDARVEQLAARELPGLLRLWLPFHVAQAGDLRSAPSLFARLARALIDPGFQDSDGWVRKGRDLFFAAEDRWHDPGLSRAIGNLLGNDLGQMRVQFNARTYVVEPVYRDDNLGLWEPDPTQPPEASAADVVVEGVRTRQEAEQPAERERIDEQPETPSGREIAVSLREDDGAVALTRLPEWDYQARRERPEWTTVLDVPAGLGQGDWLERLYERQSELVRRLDRLIAAARVGRPQRLRRQADGELLDLDACIDALISLRAGQLPDTRVFQRHAQRERDLSVCVLLDVSQSTADPVPGARRVLDVEREAVALLAHAMARAGDPCEVLAFQSNGREEVRVQTIKALDEPFGRLQGARLAGLRSGLSTRLGAALRYAGRGLAGRRAHRRLVLLLTDGEPSDVDCPDPRYLIEDARHAVHGLAARGVDCFAVAVGRSNRAVLDRMFGPRNHVTIGALATLPERLPLLYLRLTR